MTLYKPIDGDIIKILPVLTKNDKGKVIHVEDSHMKVISEDGYVFNPESNEICKDNKEWTLNITI